MRLIEIRLLDGPNLYRLEPAVKLEVAVGRRRSWYGSREPARHAVVRLRVHVARRQQPPAVVALTSWVGALRRRHRDAPGRLTVHRSSDPGHWIVAWPWAHADRARAIAEAAVTLAEREVVLPRGGSASAMLHSSAAARLLARLENRIATAIGRGPEWVTDADRRLPVVSISGTNGKTTTTRLIAHVLATAGRRVGATTSDGIVVRGELVEAGDWTGPAGAGAILGRTDLDVAVLETARGGILLRGVGYESNDVGVITNVSSDHLDVQGIHTLPELAEVKGVICRITRPDGWVVLNADDHHLAGIARSVRAHVALFSLAGDGSPRLRRHLRRGGRGYLVRDGWIGQADGAAWRPIVALRDAPVTLGGIARHNVANALAATAAAVALGATPDEVRRGLETFSPTSDASPGRLNLFQRGERVVIVDFAHNEAGAEVLMEVAAAVARGLGGTRRGGSPAPVTAIVGLAGDRPVDTMRGVGRIVGRHAQRVVIKELLHYLRGRTREAVVGEIRAGAAESGYADAIPVHETEALALAAELDRVDDGPRVVAIAVHEDRLSVFALLGERGFEAVTNADRLAALLGV
ncbi:MAG TPA: Mur ligase family protein [Candidatus Deferrimicrobiaceae bacterium]|nr:Mur ligase family protein [Candidatus Deferrimicrobiaceae bacterium]